MIVVFPERHGAYRGDTTTDSLRHEDKCITNQLRDPHFALSCRYHLGTVVPLLRQLCRSSWLDQRCLPLVDTTLLVVVMPLLWRSLAALASLRFGGWEGNPTREPDVARESTPGPSTGVPP